jgi:hypothetical protein
MCSKLRVVRVFLTNLQITKTYAFLTPDLWREIALSKFPYDEHSAHLQLAGKKH